MRAGCLSLLVVAAGLTACQTATASRSDQAITEVAGRLLAIPLLMERCQAVDPGNRKLYEEEKVAFEQRNRWIKDATYRAAEKKIGSTREGIEAFLVGVGKKRVDDLFSWLGDDEKGKGCLKALSQCRLGDPQCGPLEKLMPGQVREVLAEAAR